MKKYGVLFGLLIIGLLIGPFYWWWCDNKTGENYRIYELFTPAQNDWFAPLGELTPAMNNLVFTVVTSYSHETPLLNDRETGFRATFKKDKLILWEAPYTLSAEKDKKQSFGAAEGGRIHVEERTVVKRCRINEAGEYFFSIDKIGRDELAIKRAVLEIKRNVVGPNMKVVATGIGLAVLALASMILLITRAFKRPKTVSAE